MKIGIVGAGAFGTALAVVLAEADQAVTLIGRECDEINRMATTRKAKRLPGITLPQNLAVSAGFDGLAAFDKILLAMPMQALAGFLLSHSSALRGKPLVACCKGIDMTRLVGPTAIISQAVPDAMPAVLTGPSFAADIAKGLPTALTLACQDDPTGARLQAALAVPTLRLYRTTDTIGAELGGALKNVMAIACGACIGTGMGDSARAALMTRGFAEMQRLGAHLGARAETLMGLSGLGDLVLTCTSDLSRNYRYGLAMGQGAGFDPSTTVEGAATARAVAALATAQDLDLPISAQVAGLVEGRYSVADAMQTLLNRPLKEE
jgi:glycerol-3-phosphate dehydrogenase (NAD(P)+)